MKEEAQSLGGSRGLRKGSWGRGAHLPAPARPDFALTAFLRELLAMQSPPQRWRPQAASRPPRPNSDLGRVCQALNKGWPLLLIKYLKRL